MKRKVVLYIGISIDGYIADKNGGVSWLGGEDLNYEGDNGYNEFIKNIDTIVLGMNTYKQIVTELSSDIWPYSGMKSYILTHRENESTDEIEFLNEDVVSLIKRLKKEDGKDIWICGGANIVNQLVKQDIIDEYHLTLMPIILGGGIRLFDDENEAIKLHLVETKAENGMIDCIYQRE